MARLLAAVLAAAALGAAAAAPLRWTNITVTGEFPTARKQAAIGVDAWRNRLIVYGGTGIGGIQEDTRMLNLTTGVFTDLTPGLTTFPPKRFSMVSGVAQSHSLGLDAFYVTTGLGEMNYNDVWAFNFSSNTWREISTTGTPPTIRYGSVGGIDPTNPRWLSVSHGVGLGPRRDDSFMLDLLTATWYNVTSVKDTARPTRRCLGGGTATLGGSTIVMHGGCGTGGFGPCPGADIWALNTAPAPPATSGATPTSARGPGLWSRMPDCAGPRLDATVAPFPNSTRAVVSFGGHGGLYGSGEQGQVSVLDVPTGEWQIVIPEGTGPTIRSGAVMATHSLPGNTGGSQGVYFFGGSDGSRELWLLSGDETTGLRTLECESVAPLREVHGMLMIWGWGILLPVGVTIARFGRSAGPLWYTAHWVIQVLGLLVQFSAFIVAVLMIQSSQVFSLSLLTTHGRLGLAIVLLGIQQGVNGCLRPHKDKTAPPSTVRIVWEYAHKWIGRLLMLLGLLNPFSGAAHLGVSDFVVTLYSVWVGLLVAFWVIATLWGYPTPTTNPSWVADFFRGLWPAGVCDSCIRRLGPGSVGGWDTMPCAKKGGDGEASLTKAGSASGSGEEGEASPGKSGTVAPAPAPAPVVEGGDVELTESKAGHA